MHVGYTVMMAKVIEYAIFFFFFQAEDGIRDYKVTGVQTCALPISFAVFVAAGLAAGSVVFVSPKQNTAAANDRATATTAIRVLIMRRFGQKCRKASISIRAQRRQRRSISLVTGHMSLVTFSC